MCAPAVDGAAQGVEIDHQRSCSTATGRLTQACAAISLGDYVSSYLALLYGADPSATPVLTHVKEQMAAFGQDEEVGDAYDD